jgi:hypothetical protein
VFCVATLFEEAYGEIPYSMRSPVFSPHFYDRPLFTPSIWVALRRQGSQVRTDERSEDRPTIGRPILSGAPFSSFEGV